MPTDKQIEALLYHSRYCWWEEEKKKIMKKRTFEEIREEICKLQKELEEAKKREELEESGVVVFPDREERFKFMYGGTIFEAYVGNAELGISPGCNTFLKLTIIGNADR